MISTTKRANRALPIAIVSALAIIGAFISTNISSASNPITSTSTTVEVIVEYEAIPPIINDISPKHGPESGGTLITITGDHLDDVTSITVGGAECKPITIISTNEITCITSAHVPGLVDVVLKSDDGTTTSYGAYTYDPILPLPPPTGDIGAPGTGMFLLGTSGAVTCYDVIFICFIVALAIGFIIYKMCIVPRKRKKNDKGRPKSQKKITKKAASRRKSTTKRKI